MDVPCSSGSQKGNKKIILSFVAAACDISYWQRRLNVHKITQLTAIVALDQ
jgi:hypothetical protein